GSRAACMRCLASSVRVIQASNNRETLRQSDRLVKGGGNDFHWRLRSTRLSIQSKEIRMPAGPSKAAPRSHRHGGKSTDKDFRVRQGNTRNHILQMAVEEFSAKGFDGARVDSIAVRAGVSKNVIYHYFKSKESLFVEVMEHTYGGIRSL